jgi:hypothetical protein
MRVNGAGRAELARQRLPLTTGVQHVDDGGEYLPRRHGLPSRTRLALIASIRSPLPHGDQRPDLVPKCVHDLICAMNVIVAQASAKCTKQSTTETIESTI